MPNRPVRLNFQIQYIYSQKYFKFIYICRTINGGEGIEEDSDDEGQDAEPMEDDDDEDNRIAGILKRHALAQMLFNGD